MLQNVTLLAIVAIHTAANELSKVRSHSITLQPAGWAARCGRWTWAALALEVAGQRADLPVLGAPLDARARVAERLRPGPGALDLS